MLLISATCAIMHNMWIRIVERECNEKDGDEDIVTDTDYDSMDRVKPNCAEGGDRGREYVDGVQQVHDNVIDIDTE